MEHRTAQSTTYKRTNNKYFSVASVEFKSKTEGIVFVSKRVNWLENFSPERWLRENGGSVDVRGEGGEGCAN